MEVISIMSRKGGVGKTATAHALGAALMKRGQGIFPTQGLNPVLLHCIQTLYPLSHQGSCTKMPT